MHNLSRNLSKNPPHRPPGPTIRGCDGGKGHAWLCLICQKIIPTPDDTQNLACHFFRSSLSYWLRKISRQLQISRLSGPQLLMVFHAEVGVAKL